MDVNLLNVVLDYDKKRNLLVKKFRVFPFCMEFIFYESELRTLEVGPKRPFIQRKATTYVQWALGIIGSHVFEPCPPFWLCYQPWLLRTPSAPFMFHLTPSTDSLRSISLLEWLKTCPGDLAKHARAFLLMAARGPSFFFFLIFSVSQPRLLALQG